MGPQGLRGERGEVGPRGLTGATGAAGRDGINGRDGAQGPRGEKGERGEAGPRGLDGRSTISIVQSFAFGGLYSTSDKIFQIPACDDVLHFNLFESFPMHGITTDGSGNLIIPGDGVYEIEYGASLVGLDSARDVELGLILNGQFIENASVSHLIGVRGGYALAADYNAKFFLNLSGGDVLGLGFKTCGALFSIEPAKGLNIFLTVKELLGSTDDLLSSLDYVDTNGSDVYFGNENIVDEVADDAGCCAEGSAVSEPEYVEYEEIVYEEPEYYEEVYEDAPEYYENEHDCLN
jgi:hypothetical protein